MKFSSFFNTPASGATRNPERANNTESESRPLSGRDLLAMTLVGTLTAGGINEIRNLINADEEKFTQELSEEMNALSGTIVRLDQATPLIEAVTTTDQVTDPHASEPKPESELELAHVKPDNSVAEQLEQHEGPFRTVEWYIMNNQEFGAENGPALVEAAYHKQLHHLQSYDDRDQVDDFDAALHRIAPTPADLKENPDLIDYHETVRAIFQQQGFDDRIAFGLPIQESFFTPDEISSGDALGAFQVKVNTVVGVYANHPNLFFQHFPELQESVTAAADALRVEKDLLQRDALHLTIKKKFSAADLKLTIRKKLLTDVSFGATMSAQILNDELQRYPDPDLALTAYNTGFSLNLSPSERRNATYDSFAESMAGKIAKIARDVRANHTTHVIQKGDTLHGLRKKFPQFSLEEIRKRAGGSDSLQINAKTALPITEKQIIAKIKDRAHEYIEPLEYAAKVRAAGDAIAQTSDFAYLVEEDVATRVAQK